MRGFKPSRCVFGLFAAAILASGIAAADTIEVTSVGLGDSGIYIDEDIDGTLTPTDVYFAGIIDIQLTDSSGTYDRTTMCVQLLTDINLGTVYNTTVVAPSQATVNSPTTNGALEQIAWLLDNVTPTTGDQAAGLQLAIWKIAEDGVDTGSNLSFTKGLVQIVQSGNDTTPTAIVTYADTYLAQSVGHSTDAAFVYENVTTGRNPTAVQMLEGLQFSGGPQPFTPESSTFVLAGAALLALGHRVRRRAR